MLPSIFGMIDDVYAAVDWEIGGDVDGYLDWNVVAWRIVIIYHIGC